MLPHVSVAEPFGLHSRSAQEVAATPVLPQESTQLAVEVQVHGQCASGFPQVSKAVPFELHARPEHDVAAVPILPQVSVQVATDTHVGIYG